MAFLTRYRELRDMTQDGHDEVEYNFGRVFQQLGMHLATIFVSSFLTKSPGVGLHSLAIRHYQRVLAAAEARTERDPEVRGFPHLFPPF